MIIPSESWSFYFFQSMSQMLFVLVYYFDIHII